MKVLLCGISHLNNFGCEAIIRSTYQMLKYTFDDVKVVYASRNAVEDKEIIKDLDIDVIQLSRKPDVFSRIINKIAMLINIRERVSFDKYREICKGIDLQISVGGDIYTIEKTLLQKKRRYNNRLIKIEKYAKRQGICMVLYGASVGPFPEYMNNQCYFINHIKNCFDMIVCREQRSVDYLSTMGVVDSVKLSPDPAFYLSTGQPLLEGHGIAINLSKRLLDPEKEYSIQVGEIAQIVQDIYDRTGENLTLIPHVYSEDKDDNDYVFLQDIMQNIPEAYYDKIILINSKTMGYMGVKNILRDKKIVVAARMHCAINAMSESVPTILISYSDKSLGVAKAIYGNEKWVIKDNALKEQLVDMCKNMIKDNNHPGKHSEYIGFRTGES